MADKPEVLAKANPNRHGWVKLLHYTDGYGLTPYEVSVDIDSDYDPETWDFQEYEDARAFFDKTVEELNNTRNQRAQDEYDDEHGTINGYPEWQLRGREY